MFKRSIAALAVSALIATAGCAGDGETPGASSEGDKTLVIGGALTARHLNPAVQSGMATAIPGAQLFASPVRFTDSFEPEPYLASSWDVAPDGLTVTLELVEDAVFHDGEPVTSRDVAFSIDVVKNNHPFGAGLFGKVEKVDTPDDHTVVIRLSAPHPALMLAMSPIFLPVLPQHVYGEGDIATHPQNAEGLIGSGPYRLMEYREGDRVVMERFEDFFDDNSPEIDQLIIKITPAGETAASALAAGEVDIAMVSEPGTAAILKQTDGVTIAEEGFEAGGSQNGIEFNTKHPILQDVRVRQALAYAIDTDFIVNELHDSFSAKATGPIFPGTPYYDESTAKEYPLDLAKAEALLDEAGHPVKADGTRFSLTIDHVPGGEAFHKNVAETVKGQLAKIGVQVEVRNSPDFTAWAERVSNYDFDMTTDNIWNWGDPTIGVGRTYLCSNIKKGVVWANMSQYCNDEVDRLFERAATTLDEGERKALYSEIQDILTTDLPVYWVETSPYLNAYTDRVQSPPNGIFGLMSPLLDVDVSS